MCTGGACNFHLVALCPLCLDANRVSFQILGLSMRSYVLLQLLNIPTGAGKMLDTWAVLAGTVSVLFLLCWLVLLSWGQLYARTFFLFPSCWLSAVTGGPACLSHLCCRYHTSALGPPIPGISGSAVSSSTQSEWHASSACQATLVFQHLSLQIRGRQWGPTRVSLT